MAASPLVADDLLVPAEYPTIQAAINAAEVGDEVIVSPGVYNESIDFLGKAITVRSVAGPENTRISAVGTGLPVVVFNSGETPDSNFEGFFVSDGSAFRDGHMNAGAGIFVRNSSPTLSNLIVSGNGIADGSGLFFENSFALIENVIVTENSGLTGGGVYVKRGGPTFNNVTFAGNEANSAGAGMAAFYSRTALTNCRFIGNTGPEFGGGLYVSGGAGLTVENSEFINNEATTGGGGIVARQCGSAFSNCRVSGNRAPIGGGLYVIDLSSAVVHNTIISGNEAASLGGGVATNGSRPQFSGVIVIGNNSGIYAGHWTSVGIDNSIIIDNSGSGSDDRNDLYGELSNPDVRYSIVPASATHNSGEGVINADPQFMNAAGQDGIIGTRDDDLRLRPGSPAIDAGNNELWNIGPSQDFNGNVRFVDDPGTVDTGVGIGPIIDIGAIEYQPGVDGIHLDVGPFVGGEVSPMRISGGVPGARVVVAWGLEVGRMDMNMPGFCMSFG
ncbi:MAG: choice-of-anchor Q domain-containing protein, partial [Planctomycetota bacterium]